MYYPKYETAMIYVYHNSSNWKFCLDLIHTSSICTRILITLNFINSFEILYIPIYAGRYPYKSSNGYMSEPEPNYDSDYSLKYNTLDRRRTPSASSQYENNRWVVGGDGGALMTSFHAHSIHYRSKFGTMEQPVQPNTLSYRNQPRRIENYTPGHSSISEKESKQVCVCLHSRPISGRRCINCTEEVNYFQNSFNFIHFISYLWMFLIKLIFML